MSTRIYQQGTDGIDYCKFGFIVANELKSSAVQRKLTAKRIKSIENFHPQLTRPVVIRPNPDGTYRHIEGQLTVKAWIDNVNPKVRIPCQIITDENISDALAIININNTSAFNWPDKIRALLVDGDPMALVMNEIVEEVGFTLRTVSHRRARFQFSYGCNPGLWFFFVKHGERKFHAVMEMLRDLFTRPDKEDLENDAASDMKFWHGLKAVYARHTTHKIYGVFDAEDLSASDIISRARCRINSCSNGGLQNMVTQVMLDMMDEYE